MACVVANFGRGWRNRLQDLPLHVQLHHCCGLGAYAHLTYPLHNLGVMNQQRIRRKVYSNQSTQDMRDSCIFARTCLLPTV